MTDTDRDAVERIKAYLNTRGKLLLSDGDHIHGIGNGKGGVIGLNASDVAALLAAKEAAEAREREAVMQALAHLGQAQDAWEAQTKAEAEAAALRERLEVAKGALQQMVGGKMYYGIDGFSMPHEPESSRLARQALATIDQTKEGDSDE